MATTVDTLLVRIESDMKGLKKDLNTIEKRTSKMGDAFKRLGPIIATAFAGIGLGKVVGTIRQFEDLQATLRAITQDAKLASASFDLIRKFTATTTFQLEQVTGAFITLANSGIAPTSDVLRDVGNLAAGRGKDIRDVAQAIFNATTGEMEMLKQLGIIARVDGEKLAVTYNGITQTIERSGESIVNYIREISQANFGTALEERANTLSGAISNLGDSTSEFFMAIGEGGLKTALRDIALQAKAWLDENRKLATVIGSALGSIIQSFAKILEVIGENMQYIVAVTGTYLAMLVGGKLAAGVAGFVALAKAIRTAGAAQLVLSKAFKKSPIYLLALGLTAAADQLGVLDDVIDKVAGIEDGTEEASKSMKELDEDIKKLGITAQSNISKGLAKSLGEVTDEIGKARLRMMNMSEEMLDALEDAGVRGLDGGLLNYDASGEEAEQIQELIGKVLELKRVKKELDQISMARGMLEEKTEAEALTEKIEALAAYIDRYGDANGRAWAKMQELTGELRMQDPLLKSIRDAYVEAGQEISQTLADAMTSGELSLSKFADISRTLVNKIIAKFLELSIINPIMNSIFGSFGGGTAAAPTSNYQPLPTFSSTPRLAAAGGMMHPSMPTLVGERGPELFVPHSTGTLLNNMNTQNALGGQAVTINQSLNFALGVTDTVRAEISNMMPVINQSAVNAVQNARQRGGALADTFGA
jgi:hypothetical protein